MNLFWQHVQRGNSAEVFNYSFCGEFDHQIVLYSIAMTEIIFMLAATCNQRWAQLSKVPQFEIPKFRWGSTSSTQKASVWLINQNCGRRPFGLACTGMFINIDQSLPIFTGFQVEEVDPQRNFRTSKRGTLVNWALLCLQCTMKYPFPRYELMRGGTWYYAPCLMEEFASIWVIL